MDSEVPVHRSFHCFRVHAFIHIACILLLLDHSTRVWWEKPFTLWHPGSRERDRWIDRQTLCLWASSFWSPLAPPYWRCYSCSEWVFLPLVAVPHANLLLKGPHSRTSKRALLLCGAFLSSIKWTVRINLMCWFSLIEYSLVIFAFYE